jgi:NDP-sugar pyrophosphorylase family protein
MIINSSVSTLPLFVLAGGFGTRLQSVLEGFPKALAPVHGTPFLLLQLECWRKQGITSFVFLLHHQADLIIEILKSEENKLLRGCKVQYVIEPKPMGTGGAISYAIKYLAFEGEFLLANADTWLGFGIDQIMDVATPAILAVKVKNVGRYGEVVFDKDHLITAFHEKKINAKDGWINAGVSRMNANFFREWDGQPFSLEEISYPKLVTNGVLRVITLEATFIDIGIPQDYARFCDWIASGRVTEL